MKIKTKVYLVKDFENLDTKERALVKAAAKDSKQQIHKGTKRIIKKVKKKWPKISPMLSLKVARVEVENLYSSFTKSLQRYGVDLLMFQS